MDVCERSSSEGSHRRTARCRPGIEMLTDADMLSTEPQPFVTRTQYDIVVEGDTLNTSAVAPSIGVVPEYH